MKSNSSLPMKQALANDAAMFIGIKADERKLVNVARDIIVPVRYSEDEFLQLHKLTKHSGLPSKSEYIRQASLHSHIKPPPPPEYFAALREINAQGNNLNQLTFIANATGNVQAIMELKELENQRRATLAAIKAPFINY